ncbi:helix-turn-helix domain-containing protein [Micromonospora sp. KC606]|uniref:helix-turn-helix domain-containing protein n=1 Tax=Micromonospora sp. KC606 TaxID=2530379 RepID=UPI00104990C7|nr:helix-turn-helix transcriptional regulator [Micromonospora sp. KC606]TDC82873.1 helix-turn-helix domain-containing protein [Micromonospora sp. KC606]
MLEQPTFGQRLRALRIKRGLSQAALAGDVISTGYLSRLESGARRPTVRVAEYLAERLNAPMTEFEAPPGETGRAAVQTSVVAPILAAVISGADDDLADTLADALRTGEEWDPALRWEGLWLLAGARGRQGRHDDEHALFSKLVELSDELGIPTLQARARTQLSRCARIRGDNVAAREHAAEAHRVAAGISLGDRIAALQALVSVEAELGLFTEARTHVDELCALTEPAGDKHHAEALWAAATVRVRQNDHAGARALLERALNTLDSRRDLVMWLRLRLAAASLYLQGSPAVTGRARAVLEEVAPVVGLVGTELHQQQLLTLRAHLAFEEGRLDEARASCAQIGDEPALLSFRERIRFAALCGRLRIADGDREGGIEALQDLARQSESAHNVELAAEIWRVLAETLAAGYAAPAGTARKQGRTRSRAR